MPLFSCEGLSPRERMNAIAQGKAEVRFFCVSESGGYFQFWDKALYDSPQFGDLYHARGYKSKSAAMARQRALSDIRTGGWPTILLKQLVFLEKP